MTPRRRRRRRTASATAMAMATATIATMAQLRAPLQVATATTARNVWPTGDATWATGCSILRDVRLSRHTGGRDLLISSGLARGEAPASLRRTKKTRVGKHCTLEAIAPRRPPVKRLGERQAAGMGGAVGPLGTQGLANVQCMRALQPPFWPLLPACPPANSLASTVKAAAKASRRRC